MNASVTCVQQVFSKTTRLLCFADLLQIATHIKNSHRYPKFMKIQRIVQ